MEHLIAPTLESSKIAIVVIALVYAVVGRASFLSNIAPGNISSIFPAAGIALAAVLILGFPALLSVWVGSFVANMLFFFVAPVPRTHTPEVAILVSLFIGFGAASGAGAGAGAGAFLVNLFCKNQHHLYSEWNVPILLTIGALGCCVISPTMFFVSLPIDKNMGSGEADACSA